MSYLMVNDDGQEQEHHSMYPQMMTNYLPLPVPELPSLQSLMLSSSSLPHSYLMHQPSVIQQTQELPPPLLPPQPLSSLPMTIGGSTTQQQHEQCVNGCDYNGSTNVDNTRITASERITNDSLPHSRQPQSEERTVAAGMTSSVIINDNILSRQQRSNNDEVAETTQPSTTTAVKPNSGVKNQNTVTVDDNKVVTVCKRTILSAINKIIADNYDSALFKLRKIIRVLDVLMFNKDGSGIGSANIETVRPWWETLKDMEDQVSQKHRQHHNTNDDQNSGNNGFMKSSHSYRRQIRLKSRNNGSINYANKRNTTFHCYKNYSSSNSSIGNCGGNLRQIWKKSNNKRYRTTGKLIMEHNLDHYRHRWIY